MNWWCGYIGAEPFSKFVGRGQGCLYRVSAGATDVLGFGMLKGVDDDFYGVVFEVIESNVGIVGLAHGANDHPGLLAVGLLQ